MLRKARGNRNCNPCLKKISLDVWMPSDEIKRDLREVYAIFHRLVITIGE